ncbi:MAG TPA: RDD family protein [Acidimicrobiales bacterium]|nr:RDD family protein [Acidimicrobiales bacterium]
MTDGGAPAGWYPDPDGPGWRRYFDGTAWTEHRTPSSGYAPPGYAPPGYGNLWPGAPAWKGAQFGRPHFGPGALASPGRRLAARALDALVLVPVLALFTVIAVLVVAPRAGPIFPRINTELNAPAPTPGFVWIYLAVFACVLMTGVVMVVYETVATARFGRTLGKAWLHIRPIRTDGSRLGWGRSFGRVSLYWLSGFLSWLGLLDPLWCLWDGNQQCLHDKAAGTLVINDVAPGSTDVPMTAAAIWAATPMGPDGWQTQDQPQPTMPPPGYADLYRQGVFGSVLPRNDGLAIASLVCSVAGILFVGVPAILGVIFGFVARAQIRRSSGVLIGEGLALSGIITGFVIITCWALLIILPKVLQTHS